MPDDLNPSQTPPTTPTTETPPAAGSDQSISQLIQALESERSTKSQLEEKLKELDKRRVESEKTIEQYKAINPERYQQLLKAEQEREEQDLIREQQYEQVTGRYKAEAETATRKSGEWQGKYEQLVTETAVRSAFFENGGIKPQYDVESGVEDVPPVEAILNLLAPRLKLEEGKVLLTDRYGQIETNAEGKPKTLSEKMTELKKGSMGALFERQTRPAGGGMANGTTIQSNGRPVKLFSIEDARSGRASIDDIASGKAFVR